MHRDTNFRGQWRFCTLLLVLLAARTAGDGLAQAPATAPGGAPAAQAPRSPPDEPLVLGPEDRPRVERLVFEGVEALDEGALRSSIVTDETRCLGFILLRPLCWITDWGLIHERHHLDPTELPRDEVRLRTAYARRGYREAAVTAAVRPRGEGVEVVFRVEEGEPTVIESIEVRQSDEVLSSGRVRRAGLPERGDPLNLIALDTAVADLAVALGERGYLDGIIHDTVDVAPDARRARIEVVIDPGRRATLGEVEVRGNREVSDQTIARALFLREGRVLRAPDLTASQRSLYDSNLFHEAQVTVPAQPDSVKRLIVEVREAPPRAARIGGGFNSVEFGQLEARFTHHNWFGGGRRLDIRGTLGNLLAPQLNGRIFSDVLPRGVSPDEESPFLRPTWLASAELLQPGFRSAWNVLGLSVFTHRRVIPGIVVEEGFGTDVSVTRRLDRFTPLSLSFRPELTAVDAGDLYFCVNYGICDPPTITALQERQMLAPFSLSFVVNRSDDQLAPTIGHRVRLDLEHASGFSLSEFRYNRVSGAAAYYRPLDVLRRSVLAVRARAGWVRPLESTGRAVGLTDDEALLHPRKRFYSGGARSVRGYRENQLGPRILTVDPARLTDEDGGCTPAEVADGTCDPSGVAASAFVPRPMGGTSVIEGNVEYRFPLFGGLIGAVFVDGAVVGDGFAGLFSESVAAVTPGVGARLGTPFGPLRVDLGVRPRIIEDLPVMTELVDEEGQRRLVRLETLRRFDPIEARGGGFLGSILGRLTLHFSIGEAF